MDSLFTQIFPAPPGDLLLGDWQATPLLTETAAQLAAFFTGKRRGFDLPLCLVGTPFQMRVWQALRAIPCGETRSYQDIARAIGNVNATRAVAGAIRSNPLSVVVPCHRVIGKNGGLTGYNGGTAALYIKERLLALERGARELGLA